MKYAWIDAQRKAYPLPVMCETLSVSASGYRAWKRGGSPGRKRLTAAQLLALITAIHKELKGAYGSPRMVRELRARGFPASKPRVERLMRQNGIRGRHKRRYKATTDSKHNLPVAANLLDRNFSPTAPNQAWSADLTYIWTDEGWLYLAVVLDLFNREIVGWSIKPRMTVDIVTDALTMAWFRRRPAPGPGPTPPASPPRATPRALAGTRPAALRTPGARAPRRRRFPRIPRTGTRRPG